MWTYSPGSLSTWAASQYLADILWPIDASPLNEPEESSVLKQLDLTPKDLENESIRKMLESEWPQIIEGMLVVAWLRRPDVPFYKIYELCQHLTEFSEYLDCHRNDIIGQGRPSQPFKDSPWLNAGLSNLYPLESGINQIHGERYSRILRKELLKTKIDVVDFLAKNLRVENPGVVSKQALDLARSRYPSYRFREFDGLEEIHRREQIRHSCPQEISFTGGYADIVRLIAYCEKETTLGTFDKAKSQLLSLSPEHQLSSYIEMSRSPKKEQLDEVIWMLQSDLENETGFYQEFSTRTRISKEVARFAKSIGVGGDYMFSFTGRDWRIQWNGSDILSFQNLIGFWYIAYLLNYPNKAIDIFELNIRVNPQEIRRHLSNPMYDGKNDAIDWENKSTRINGFGIEKTDSRTIREIREEINKIKQQLPHKLTPQRKRELRDKLKIYQDYLSDSSGHRGTSRLTGDELSKLRARITNAVKYVIEKKLRPEFPELADHLDSYLQTRQKCIYAPPNDNIKWAL